VEEEEQQEEEQKELKEEEEEVEEERKFEGRRRVERMMGSDERGATRASCEIADRLCVCTNAFFCNMT